MWWPMRKRPDRGTYVEQLDHQLDARRRHLEEVRARTPEAEAAGARAQKLVTANGFTAAIAVSMERR